MNVRTEPGLRERKKLAQRGAIYDIALVKFRQQGFAEVTVQEIAADANISLKTFFNYFPSKQAVLDECVLNLLRGFSEFVAAYTEDRRPFERRLHALVADMAEALEADPEFWRMIFTESKLFNASGAIKTEELQVYDAIAGLFRSSQASGEINRKADPVQLAEIFFSIYYLTSLNWLAGWWPRKLSLKKRLRSACTIFLNGVTHERTK